MDEARSSEKKKKRRRADGVEGSEKKKKKRRADEVEGSEKKKKRRRANEVEGSEKKKKRKAEGSEKKKKKRKAEGSVKSKRTRAQEEAPVVAKKRRTKYKGRIGPVVIAHAPNLPCRYEYLLKLITFIVPCESPGNAYVCPLNKIQKLLRHRKCDLGLYFEWFGPDRKMICRMFNGRTHFEFTVNPAFLCVLLRVRVKHAACSFSVNFCCDETWEAVKKTLEMIFCPPQHASPKAPAPDHLYVFTKVNDRVYFRNLKINETPASARAREDASVHEEIDETPSNACEDAFAFEEVGPYFCLKLVDVHRENDASQRALDVSKSQIKSVQRLCLTSSVYLSLSSHIESTLAHSLCLNGKKYFVLLENGEDLSVYEGYNISLREFLEDEPFLKTKHIIASKTREEMTFARNVGKLIIRSIFKNLVELFSSDICINMETQTLHYTNILLKGSSVKFYGVELMKYDDENAKRNVRQIVELVRHCFPDGVPPVDIQELLNLLNDDPLQYIQMACEDSSLLPAKYRRQMMILLHTEYFTNVKPQFMKSGDYETKCNEFFSQSPYLDNWIRTCEKNLYMDAVADYNKTIKELRREKKGQEDNIKKGEEGERGELQFCIMRNSDVHVPERAVEDGIIPFRLSWTDYIRTAYFPRYLAFIQKSMRQYLKCTPEVYSVEEGTKAIEKAGNALQEGTM